MPRSRTSWKPGQSGNPKGRPRDGESWAAVFKRVMNMTPSEAAGLAGEIGKRLKKYGGQLPLKELIALRVADALLFEPQASLLVAVMDRAEGKVKDVLEQSGSVTVVIEAPKWTPK